MRSTIVVLAAHAGYALAQLSPSLPSTLSASYVQGSSSPSDQPSASPTIQTLPSMTSTTASAAGAAVSLFLPMGNEYPIAASVVTAAPSLTVYALGCPTAQGACVQCDFSEQLTITAGPSTVIFTTGLPQAHVVSLSDGQSSLTRVMATVNCAMDGTTAAVCTELSTQYWGNVHAETVTLAASDMSSLYAPVTMTSSLPPMGPSATNGGGASATSGGPVMQQNSAGEATKQRLGGLAAVGVAGVALMGLL